MNIKVTVSPTPLLIVPVPLAFVVMFAVLFVKASKLRMPAEKR